MYLRNIIKYILILGFLLIFIGILYINEDKFNDLYKDLIYKDSDYKVTEKNEYYRDYDFTFVQNVDEMIATKKSDLKNIYYTGLNTGKTSFEFKCSNKYKNCIKDVQKIADDNTMLSNINNFVHPYNSFKNINTTYNKLGIITVEINHMYNEEEKEFINNKIDSIYPALTQGYNKNDVNSIKNTITTIHNYIINTTRYDSDRADNNIKKYKSDIAYGPLFEGYALCGGYTDLLELFLEKMEIKSYKVSSQMHIWNAININNQWYNVDLTWDDPVTNTGEDMLLTDYLLVESNTMQEKDTSQHIFNTEIYNELKST